MVQSLDILNDFNVLTLKQVWKTRTRVPFFESINIESATFPYKTDLSKANVKTINMENTRWTYRKQRRFATTYLTHFSPVSHFYTL